MKKKSLFKKTTFIFHINLGYRKDAHLKTTGVVTKLMAIPVEVGDVTSVELLYKKKGGFFFSWGAGADDINVMSVSVMSGELGDR